MTIKQAREKGIEAIVKEWEEDGLAFEDRLRFILNDYTNSLLDAVESSLPEDQDVPGWDSQTSMGNFDDVFNDGYDVGEARGYNDALNTVSERIREGRV